jgi:5-methylcytosine-specific restriction enzyme subunit McrC
MYAYGHHYLDGAGGIVLIYPNANAFIVPLPVFDFPKAIAMHLWVLSFCLNDRRLKLPASPQLPSVFVGENGKASQAEDFTAAPTKATLMKAVSSPVQ